VRNLLTDQADVPDPRLALTASFPTPCGAPARKATAERRGLDLGANKAPVFTSGRICELYPDAVRAMAAAGHAMRREFGQKAGQILQERFSLQAVR
jgi:hypothetical protein